MLSKGQYIQKEKRIADILEPVVSQHRLVISKQLIKKDYDSAADPKYSLFYQLTRLTRLEGALRHDDRLDILSGAVRYWTEQMARDTEKAAQEHDDRLLDMELKKFKDGILGSDGGGNVWINLPG